MRIVITGASGNVGSALLRRLASSGEHELVGVARRLPDQAPPFDAATWHALDLTSEGCVGPLTEVVEGADAVVHLAWGFQPTHDEAHLRELALGGTRRVLGAVAAAGVPHLVHMSSIGAYSPRRDDHPVAEDWPTRGVPSSMYSRHKAAAERLLDDFEATQPDVTVSRMRPGIIGQRDAGSSLLRYGLPGLVPASVLRHVPVLPLDRRLRLPMVHADDVADAFVRVLQQRAGGAFNLAAPPLITVDDLGSALEARPVHVPAGLLRAVVLASWRARLQPVDPGWLDMAYSVPALDTGRAARVLGWEPRTDALTVLRETLAGMSSAQAGSSPVLRRRNVPAAVGRALSRGPVGHRHEP